MQASVSAWQKSERCWNAMRQQRQREQTEARSIAPVVRQTNVNQAHSVGCRQRERELTLSLSGGLRWRSLKRVAFRALIVKRAM